MKLRGQRFLWCAYVSILEEIRSGAKRSPQCSRIARSSRRCLCRCPFLAKLCQSSPRLRTQGLLTSLAIWAGAIHFIAKDTARRHVLSSLQTELSNASGQVRTANQTMSEKTDVTDGHTNQAKVSLVYGNLALITRCRATITV